MRVAQLEKRSDNLLWSSLRYLCSLGHLSTVAPTYVAHFTSEKISGGKDIERISRRLELRL